jgi:acyl carrier protein
MSGSEHEALGIFDKKKVRDRYAFDIPFISPRTPVEEGLARIWTEVLELDRVGVNDNFFDFDGDSLLAIQITARIRQHFGAALEMRTVFQAPTIAQLAERIASVPRH